MSCPSRRAAPRAPGKTLLAAPSAVRPWFSPLPGNLRPRSVPITKSSPLAPRAGSRSRSERTTVTPLPIEGGRSMLKFHVDDIRTIALVGHGAAGKTTLADALLYRARAVDRAGSVDEGTSYSDTDDEEHKRRFSIDTSVLHAEHDGKA